MAAGSRLDRRFAQSLVDITAAELNKNVIITDEEGVIIAAFHKERIGQTHEAAARMLAGGKPGEFAVTAEDVAAMSGVREGFNVPIRYAGYCLGVIGVTGEAGEAAPYARLAARFTEAAIESNFRQEQLLRLFQEKRSLQTALLSKIIKIQEDERRRISRELHDEVGQMLTSMLLGLRMLSENIERSEAQQAIVELREMTASTLDAVRNLAIELRPMLLDDHGLPAAVRRYAERYSKQCQIHTEVSIKGFDSERLPPEVELCMYRIMQEALTNAAKHSAASRVDISIMRAGRYVMLTVTDNGTGFDASAIMTEGQDSLGLYGMQERVALLGGELTISSNAGAGTTISVKVPIK